MVVIITVYFWLDRPAHQKSFISEVIHKVAR